jgi:uncharacterized protein (TIGR01244 family)
MTVKSILSSIWLSAALICAVCHGALSLDTSGAQANKGPWYGGIVQYTELTEINSKAGSLVGLGGDTPNSAFHFLKAQGFKTVVNLRLANELEGSPESIARDAARHGLEYIHLPFNPRNLEHDVIPAFVDVMSRPDMQPVYVHCNSATRAAALWMIMRVRQDNVLLKAAIEEAKIIAARPEDAIAFAKQYLSTK